MPECTCHCCERPDSRVFKAGTLVQVICMDNFFTGTKENVAHLLDKPNFEMIRHDVVNPILLEVDEIFHLACPASPVHYKYVSCLKCSTLLRNRVQAICCMPITSSSDANVPTCSIASFGKPSALQRCLVQEKECFNCITRLRMPPWLQVQSDQDHEDQLPGHHEHARPCQAHERQAAVGVHIRGLWRPPRAPPDGVLLGQCEPYRRACLLR
jgi:ribosomal protein S26